MEVIARSEQGSATARESDERPSHSYDHRNNRRRIGCCLLVYLSLVSVALITFSTTANAHGAAGHGGIPVTFAVVVGLPVMVGLIAGVTAVALRRQTHVDQTDQFSTTVLGLLFLFLGGAFAIEAATRYLSLALAGGTAGGMVALWVAAHSRTPQRSDRHCAELTCGAISLHRVLEGFAIGALYSGGAVVGLLGAAAIAGHTVLETGAVGGQYSSYRLEAIAAIGLVQLSYAAGAIAGVGLIITFPVMIQSASLALAGGILLAIGASETRHSDIISRVAGLT